MMRLRVVGWQVTPVLMTDDGENLRPLTLPPAMIPGEDWAAFVEGGWKEQLDRLRDEIEVGE
jgi:hypothetical protein